jgi:hypothetical protein
MAKTKKSLLKIVPECISISSWEYQDSCTGYSQPESILRCEHFSEGICNNKKLIAEALKDFGDK